MSKESSARNSACAALKTNIRMEKTVKIMVAVALTFGLASCVSTPASTKTSQKMNVQQMTKADFVAKVYDYKANPDKWVFKGDKPAIIDFYATWCGPCKMVAPIMEELATEYAGKVDFYKVDTDAEQELSGLFGIRSIPSILFIPATGSGGSPESAQPQMSTGAMSKTSYKNIIDGTLLKK
jgi:thioredoxin